MSGALAIDREGDAVAAWTMGCEPACGMRASHRSASGWSEPADLLGPDTSFDVITSPRIAASGDAAMAIWSTRRGSGQALWTSWYDGRRWTEPSEVRTILAGTIDTYDVTLGERGGAVVWMESATVSDDTFVQAATFVR